MDINALRPRTLKTTPPCVNRNAPALAANCDTGASRLPLPRLLRAAGADRVHSSAASTVVNAMLSFEPSPDSTVMMATAMPAAISE